MPRVHRTAYAICLTLGCATNAGRQPLSAGAEVRTPSSHVDAAQSNALNAGMGAKERRAPGVHVEPLAPLPLARSQASSSANVVVLQAPASRSQINDVLARFFAAVSEESPEALTALFEPNAMAHFAGGASTSALGSWLRRFTRTDYRGLSPRAVFHPSRLDTFSRSDVDNLRDQRSFPLVPDATELLALVTIDDPDVALLGSRMSFVLRPHAEGYRIRATFEELAP